jgi:hypothetical protein
MDEMGLVSPCPNRAGRYSSQAVSLLPAFPDLAPPHPRPLPFALCSFAFAPLLLRIAQAQNLKPKTSPDAVRALGRTRGHCRAYEGALTLCRVPPAPGLGRLKINLPSFFPRNPMRRPLSVNRSLYPRASLRVRGMKVRSCPPPACHCRPCHW